MDEFLQLIERHKDEFYRYIRRMAWDSAVADDVFSAAVLTAYQNRHRFQEGSNFRAWMYRIITNKCFVANRETARTPENIDDHQQDLQGLGLDPAYREALDDPEKFLAACGDEVNFAMRALSSVERACILLRAMHDSSYLEIAEILNIPLGTVMTHLSRGRAKLRKRLLHAAREQGIVGAQLRILDLAAEGREENGQRAREA